MANSHHPARRSVQLIFALTTVSVLLLSSSVPFTRAGSGRFQNRSPRGDGARPQPGRPEGNFPNLNELRRQEHVPPRAAPELPSNNRSRRKPLAPRNGRTVGNETGTPPRASLSSAVRSAKATRSVPKTRSHHARTSAPVPLLDDQYMQNFFTYAVWRAPSSAEATYWLDIQRSAYANGNGSLVLAIREMGKTLFESAEYAYPVRNDHQYVSDLYQTYLLRGPDPGGWAFWESLVPSLGREAIRRAFDESTEFINLVNTITPSGSPSSAVSSLVTARTDPFNQPGSGLKSRDAEWSLPLLSLPGRAGLDLGLGLSYSSMVWTSSGPYIYFDEDNGSPSPGFRLGFPTIQERFFNAKIGDNAYLL